MTVRPINETDVPEFARLLRLMFPDTKRSEIAAWTAALFQCPAWGVFVADQGVALPLVGYLVVTERFAFVPGASTVIAYVESWYVEESARRGGVGGALFQAAKDWANAQGLLALHSDVDVDNVESQRAHLHLGAKVVEEVVHYETAVL